MELVRRALVFVTFFGSCLSLALLVASLSTDYWVQAVAHRTLNPNESEGRVHFGLFDGKKELNVAYGWRTYDINVIQTMKQDPDFMQYWLWLGAVVGVALGLAGSSVAGVSAVIQTAAGGRGVMAVLYVSNTIAALCQIASVSSWVAQYCLYLQYNVMPAEDRANSWSSNGGADLSSSFWFVVGGALASCANLILLCSTSCRGRRSEHLQAPLEEKTSGAIMLY